MKIQLFYSILKKFSLTLILLASVFSFQNVFSQLRAKDFIDGGKFGGCVYRYLKPLNYDATKKYPVVVFLHGGGERGTDNVKQIDNNTSWVDRFTSPVALQQYPAFLIAPQIPDGDHNITDIIGIIEKLKSSFSIDPDRIYITGLSRGGRGTWEAAVERHDYFACIAPSAGRLMWGDTARTVYLAINLNPALSIAQMTPIVKPWAHIPTWCSHTTDDGSVQPAWTQNIITCMRNFGGSPIYSMYTGGGHSAWWPFYSESKLLDWMFSQNKSGGIAPFSPLDITVTTATGTATIKWKTPDMTNGKIMCFHVYKNGKRLTTGLDNLTGADGSGMSKLLYAVTYSDKTYQPGDTYTVTAVNYRMQESAPSKTTDINYIENVSESVSIFPNPAKDMVTVDFGNINNNKEITLMDVQGRTVAKQNTSDNNVNIDINSCEKGIYFIKISASGFTTTKKLVIE